MGAGRPEIAERVTRSGLKMGWSYSSVIWSSSSASPNNWSRSFSPGGQDPIFFEAAPRRRHAATGRPLPPGRRDDGGLQRRPARAPGYRFWTMCISVGLHWLLLPVLFITLKDSAAVAPDRLAGAGYPLPFLQRRFYLRYRSGHWKTLTVWAKADRVAGIREEGISDVAIIGTAGPPESRFPPSIPSAARMPARPGAGDAARDAGAVADHEDVAAHPK